MRWLVGAFYFNNKVDGHYLLDLTNLGFVYFDANYNQDAESYAVFGQLEYDLSDQFTVILGRALGQRDEGARLPEPRDHGPVRADHRHRRRVRLRPELGRRSREARRGLGQRQGRARLEADRRPADLRLGRLSARSRPGSTSASSTARSIFASNTPETIPFDEEKLTSYEVGFKSTFADGRARLNGAAFYYDYSDFQTFRFELLNQVIFNTDAEVKGAELELETTPWDGWHIGLGLSALDATAHDIPSPSGVLRDRNMVAAPDFAASGSMRYEWAALGGAFAAQVSGTYEDSMYYDIQNVPVSQEDGYTVGNARLSYARERTGRSRRSSTTSRTRNTWSTRSTSRARSASTSRRTGGRAGAA